MALTGSRLESFSGGHRWLIGIKTEKRVCDVLMRFVASKQ